MSGWIVYSKDGSIERCKLRSLEYGGTAMGERAVTATFDYHSEVAFEVFDYIEYRGERFELEAVPTVKKLSSFEYQYELRFVSLKYELERCEMRDLVPSDNGVVYPTPLTFSFTGDVRYLTERIQACLDAMYGKGVWSIVISDGAKSEEKNISIAQQNCWNALALVNSTYGLSFYIKGRTITIGGEQPLVNHTFEYGKGNGLYEIERASDTGTGIVTKLRAYGSTRNLDYSYPKKPEWSDSVLPVSFALSPLRLMLPSFKTDGKTDYVLADDAAIAKYGIREASMVYDDIYPSIAGATYNGQAIDEIKSVDAVDESQKTFVVYLHELGFDLEEHLTTSDAQISMKSGALQGYTFTISSIEKQTGGYKITLGKNSLENSEESGAYVPGVNWNMKAGDKFVLLNILMPQKYIRDAENRLLARANEYLAQYSKTNFSYNIGMHDKFLIQNPSVYDSLIEGSKLKVYDKEIGIDEEVTIQSITITENLEDNILPQVKVTLNNEPSASTLDRIQGKLNEVAAETAANGFTTQSEIMAQYRRKLDKIFFDKLFVAIDENGNEIPSTDVITPIAYIKAKYHVASVGGFTMYAMDKDVDIPSLASGLPFDGRTIWYNPDTQQIEVIGGTGGGAADTVAWEGITGKPEWITNTKPVYNYTEIQGIPDLSVYAKSSDVTALSEKLNDFLEGSDTDSIINKWKELESFLSGLSESDNLATILFTKADKTYVDDTFVTLATSQTITGEKNFTGGLKVNGSPIIYDSAKKYWKLEGDLLVTGGVIMYGNDSSFNPSTIMDAIEVDGTTISKSGGVLKVIGGVGASTMGSLSNVGNWADSVADVDRIMYQAAGSSSWISKPLSSIAASGDYLPLSGGTITGDLYIGNSNNTSWMPLQFNRNGKTSFVGQGPSSVDVGFDDGYLSVGPDYFRYIKSPSQQYAVWHEGNFTPSDCLPLSGGNIGDGTKGTPLILTGNQTIVELLLKSSNGTNKGSCAWQDGYGVFIYNYTCGGLLGIKDDGTPVYGNNTLIHSGNIGSQSVNYARGSNHSWMLSMSQVQDFSSLPVSSLTSWYNWGVIDSPIGAHTYGLALASPDANIYAHLGIGRSGGLHPYIKIYDYGTDTGWRRLAFIDDTVDSATKLQTARTIWGQSFDGTGNVSGHLTGALSLRFSGDIGIWQGNMWSSLNTDDIAYYATRHLFWGNVLIGTVNGIGHSIGKQQVFSESGEWASIHYTNNAASYLSHVEGYVAVITSKSNNNGKYLLSVMYNDAELKATGTNAFSVFDNGHISIGAPYRRSKLSVHTSVVESISAGYLGTSNTVGFGNIVEGYGTYLWTTGNGNGHIQVGRENGSAVSYHLVLQELGGNVGIGESNPTDKLHVAGSLRLKTDSNYGCSLYFGDGEYCYLREATDDQLTIHARKLIIDNNTIINGNLVVRGGITMYGTDGSATDFLLDVTSWSSINSTSVNQVYTARATKLLKDKVSGMETLLTSQINALTNKIAAIKSALNGITSYSSASQIGAALNTVYNNI